MSQRAEAPLGVVVDRRLVGWMLSYARPHALALVGCVALLLLVAGLSLAEPYVIKLAIDRVLQPAAGADAAERARLVGELGPFVALYLAVGALGSIVSYAQGLWLQLVGQRIIARVREDVFGHLISLDLAFFDANPAGRLVTRVTNDVEALNEMYTSVLVNLFRDVFFIVGAMAVMWSLDRQLASMCFAVLPLVVAAAMLFQRFSRKAWREVRERLAALNAMLAENMSGMRLVQIFARERAQLSEFRAANEGYFKATWQQLQVYAVFRPLLELLSAFALVGVIWMGGHQALAGAIGFGTLYAFIRYSQELFEPVNNLAEKYNVLQSALAAAERLHQLLATRSAIEDPAVAEETVGVTIRQGPTPAVEFQDVWFAYQEEQWVLSGVSFAVLPGETAAFVGHTGAGKSTIMSLVSRFYDVQRGRVLVDGVDVRDWPIEALRRRVGVVLQDVFLFAGSVADNIALDEPAIDRSRIEHAARAVGADGFVAALEQGYDTVVAERGLSLSAGQRQLLSFARALAFDPPVLVLDEATAQIDSETEAALQRGVAALSAGRTTLVVAHRLSTIQAAHRIHVMHKGNIRESGTHTELMAFDGLYRKLWQLQFQGAGA